MVITYLDRDELYNEIQFDSASIGLKSKLSKSICVVS